ncbi:MAG: 2-hydroxychromene-2-carboxylate isomerase [Arenicellales bacterium]|jgi:2-hydroxychromene-2-carboxylate isomerase|nr:2-hydroxychromene-2-carboxylate isomerase [Arenicellales bacterium]
MTKTVEFFYDFGSPTVYLAATQLPAIAAAVGATIDWRPMLLGGVFKSTGNQSPVVVPAKAAYMNNDLERFAKRYGVPFRFNPHFPINTLALMRGAVAYQDDVVASSTYRDAIFMAIWVEARNLNEPDVIGQVLSDAGLDPAELMNRIGQQTVKDQLIANTEEAVNRGVFGAPTFFVGERMFFGQDRLDFVADALSG